MATEVLSDDRRDSVRMVAQLRSETGTRVRIGTRSIPANVLDTSAGGYLVEVNGSPKTQPDQPVELISDSGRQLLRVVWQRKVENKTNMGLQHVHHELPWRQESSWVIWMIAAVVVGLAFGAYLALGDKFQFGHHLFTRNTVVQQTTTGS